MGKSIKNISLFKIASTIFIVFFVLGLINFFVIKHYTNGLRTDAIEIEAAGKTRMLSQKMVLLIEQLENNPEVENELLAVLEEHDLILETFEKGGLLPNTEIYIEPATGMHRQLLDQSLELWNSIYSYALQYIENSNKSESKLKSVISRSRISLLNKNQQFVQSLMIRNTNRMDKLLYFLIFFLIINSVFIALTIYAIRKFIFRPINDVAGVAEKLSQGNVGVKVDYNNDNELGMVSKGINKISENLENARSFIEKIERGELTSGSDQFDNLVLENKSVENALLKMQDQMQIRQKEDQVRKWTTEGLAKFVDILRASDDLTKLCDAILSNLVEYTDSNQAGIYLLNDNDESNKHLELVSLYAFNQKKYDTRTYRLGEGLVGQTFLEAKTIYLLDIPENYVSITSGLGDANPTSILLVPLKVENDSYGVIEIASFNEYEEHHIQFVEKLGESIASTIAGVKNNEKTKHLLEESQQLTEQMQAQEEEMRQNMEELTATQEEMSRKEMSVNVQLEAINESLGMAEFALDGHLLSSNGKYNEVLGYNMTSISEASFGKLHTSVDILDKVTLGNKWSGWLKKKTLTGNEVELKSHFTPAVDDNGKILKIIEIVTQFEKEVVTNNDNGLAELQEIEEELRMNMEALEITQEELNKKLDYSQQILDTIKHVVYNEDGEILEVGKAVNQLVPLGTNIADVFLNPIDNILTEAEDVMLTLKKNEQKLTVEIKKLEIKDDHNKFLMIWS